MVHVGITHDGVAKSIKIRIWDATAGAILGTDIDTSFASTTFISDGLFSIGNRDSSFYFDGDLDEVVIFNDLLVNSEIDKIRDGTYGSLGNNFSTDNCKALWNFESGALTTDSKGSNTLIDHNSVTEDTTNCKQGSCSADFEFDSAQYLDMTDADLDSGFPLKNGDATKKISVCFWVRPESSATYRAVIAKWDNGANKRSFFISISSNKVAVLNSHTGSESDTRTHGTVMTSGQWYHVGVVHDGIAKTIRVRVWDDTNQCILGSDLVTSFSNTTTVNDSPVSVGGQVYSGTPRFFMDGNLDELVIFNYLLVNVEIDRVRAGIYGSSNNNNFDGDVNCKALWNFASGAMTTDSKGSNTLTDHNSVTEDTTNCKQGLCSANFESGSSQYFDITDADLDSSFPLKNGGTDKKISICCWIRPESWGVYTTIVSKYGNDANTRSFWLYVYGGFVYLRISKDGAGGGSLETINHASALTVDQWYHIGVIYDVAAKTVKIRIYDDTAGAILGTDKEHTFTNECYIGIAPFEIGHIASASAPRYADGNMDEIVIFNDLLTYDEIDEIRSGTYGISVTAIFSNPIPVYASTVYGVTTGLSITVTLSGTTVSSGASYTANFYDGCDDTVIGSTASGVNGSSVSGIMQTPSGIQYDWYVKAMCGGVENTSSGYVFNREFLYAGTVTDMGTLVSGIPIRLYRRDSGVLIGSTVSSGAGVFGIGTSYSDNCYAVALHSSGVVNALIYDWLEPE